MVSPLPHDLLTHSYVWHFAFLITTVTNEAFRGQENKPRFGFVTLALSVRVFFPVRSPLDLGAPPFSDRANVRRANVVSAQRVLLFHNRGSVQPHRWCIV